jgi:hypothetical protein
MEMKQTSLLIIVFLLLTIKIMAQQDTLKTNKVVDSTATSTTPNPFQAVIDSNDDNNFLELYYYGPDLDGTYDIYDPWDIYPDRDDDSGEQERDDRDGQQQDSRE